MNPGILNRKIQIQRKVPDRNALGQELYVWELYKTRMAKRLKNKGKKEESNDREHSEAAVAFRLRWTSGLLSSDRLVDLSDGQAYDIQDWDGEQREGWMEIYCVRRRTPGNKNQTPL